MSRSRIVLTAVVLVLLTGSSGFAQIDNVGDLLRGGVEDANLLTQAYLAPFGKGFGADFNNGWYSTARTHDFLGFDLSVSASAAITPTDDRSFDITALGLQNFRLSDPNADPTAPTITGDDQSGPELEIVLSNPETGSDEIIGSFVMPEGLGFRYVPSPMVQASLGVFMNTDVMVRFFPEVEVSDDIGKLRLFGVGIKHDLKQWLPGGAFLPFDLAVMAGYTVFQAESGNLNVEPDPDATPSGGTYDDQEVEIETSSLNLNVIISKQFALLTLFGGVGVEKSNVDLKVKGNFPVTVIETDQTSPNFGDRIIEDVRDPVDLSFDGANTMRANVGFQLALALFNVYGSYTIASYPVVTAGVGLSFR